MLNDNRIETRHRKRIQLRYGIESADRVGFTEDVSDEGFFIKTALVQKPGSMMQFELTLPDGALVLLSGRVRWAKKVPPNLLHRLKGGMGIKISRFDSGQSAYQAFCEQLKAR